MKARVKETGEIIDVESITDSYGNGKWRMTNADGKPRRVYNASNLEFIEPEPIDWEQMRYKIAKELFVCAYNTAVDLADTLIKELKKSRL